MASDVASDERIPAVPPAEPRPPAPRLYGSRFVFVYGALAIAFAGAIAGLVLAIDRAGVVGGARAWSSWKPTGGGEGAASQIADHVAKTYRLPNGDQLVDVITKPPSVSPSTGSAIALHYIVITGGKGSVISHYAISPANSIMYQLCGLGQACSIATGKPTVARGTLVRREILELALYTFKYVGSIKHVIAFLPPPAGRTQQYAVYLQKADLADELKVPLAQTLGSHVPLPSTIPPREVHTIDATTVSRVYQWGVTQLQTGDTVLVLKPLPA